MLNFLYTAVSFVLLLWHRLFTAIGLDKGSGLNWGLSIIFLVITARLLLFRLFVKQVHYQRHMQEMQPKISKLREKYKNDKAEMQRQMMKLQQEEGFNPLSGCLPLVLQIPVFISLFHVLRHLAASASTGYQKAHPDRLTLYGFSKTETLDGARAKIFGAPLSASFHDASSKIHDALGGDVSTTRIVIAILLVISAGATVGTQIMVRANATTTPEGTAATVQKLMIYLVPIGVLASGLLFNFPLGVLLYWFASNLWTLGQQAYIVKFHPPTQPAEVTREVGKSLAPRPGAKPSRDQKAAPRAGATSLRKEPVVDDDAPVSSGNGAKANGRASGGAGSAPRPGQRPTQQARKRPSGKRPTQAKKRR